MTLAEKIRAWARTYTADDRYSPVGQFYHWVMAALVFFQLWWGWWMSRLPVGADKLEGYQLHSRIGVLLMVLILLRGAWRLFIPGPVNDADKPGWQSTAAHLTHYAFYAILVGLPLSGWAMWSSTASSQPLSVAGVLPWPQLPLSNLPERTRWLIMRWADDIHLALVFALLLMLVGHIGAALKHHFWDRDDVLAGMVPWLEPLPKRKRQGREQAGEMDLAGWRRRPTPPRSPARSGAG